MNGSKNSWRIWNKKYEVEKRTFQRLKKQIPEMQCAKQLVQLVSCVYKPKMKILDVGCASGHYYNSLKKIDPKIIYYGIDSTKKYISYGKKFFRKNKNVNLFVQDIYKISKKHHSKYDISFCCNVLLHLPNIEIPLKKLINTSKKHCFVRTLISENTHLSQYLYSDSYKNGKPQDFVYQNTYSYKYIKKIIRSLGNYKIKFIKDNYDEKAINKEYKRYSKKQYAVTKVSNGVQLAGSKVFNWKWIQISK